MLTNLRFSDFRGFHDLSVGKLARVNLFVGTNNAGKTSLLEGAELLLSGGNLRAVVRGAQRRGELILPASDDARPEIDLCHLFNGHKATDGAHLSISGVENGQLRHVEIAIATVAPDDEPDHALQKSLPGLPSWDDLSDPDSGTGPSLLLTIQSDRLVQSPPVPLSPGGGISTMLTRRYAAPDVEIPVIHFIGTETIDPSRLSRLWDAIVLTPSEDLVVEALKLVEPRISRIASTAARGSSSSFFIKMVDSDQRIPLGSMGDGVKRLLALSMHLVRSAGGYLLVDEIDTGLHHSVMVDMWRLVVETAKRLDIQVFATTHSLDCVNALGSLIAEAPGLAEEVILHRVKATGTSTVPYSAEEVLVAAEHQMEIR